MRIERGATRVVLIFENRFAVKLPRLHTWKQFLFGLIANLQEKLFSDAKWPELCPVLFAFPLGFCSVMAYARPLTDDEWAGLNYESFTDKPDYHVPVEQKRDSFGVLAGAIVAIDYGT